MPGRLVHFEIAANDSRQAMDFYRNVFGWEFSDSGMPGIEYNMTQAGGDPGGAVYPAQEEGPYILVYFDTDDVGASVEKVRQAGGEAGDKAPIPGIGWFSHCKDPSGNAFGLFQTDESVTMPEGMPGG
jgi:predicted enzyme related to lactoylglutathione lyase